MESLSLLALAIGLGLAAGIDLYAVVLTVGLGAHLGLVQIPAQLDGLAALAHPSIALLAATGWLAQCLADKVRWLDSGWDVVHAAIRPAGAMLIAVALVGEVGSALDVAAIALAAVAAVATHAAKAGLRLVVNSIPEPLSNVAVSVAEDGVVIVGTWLAVHHPLGAIPVVLAIGVGLGALAPSLARVAGVEAWALLALVRSWLAPRAQEPAAEPPRSHAGLLPPPVAGTADTRFALRCATGGGIGTRRHDVGFLCMGGGELLFVTRQGGRLRGFPIDLGRVEEIRYRPGPALDRLTLRTGVSHAAFLVFKDGPAPLDEAVHRLRGAHASARAALLKAARAAAAAARGHAGGDVESNIRPGAAPGADPGAKPVAGPRAKPVADPRAKPVADKNGGKPV